MAMAMAMTLLVTLASAQNNSTTCSDCVFDSINKDPSCTNLDTEIQAQLKLTFGGNTINEQALSAAIKNPRIKTCVCHWTATALVQGGAASSCVSGATSLCSASSVSLIQTGISLVAPMIKCNATTSTASGGGLAPTPIAAGAQPGKTSGAGHITGNVLSAVTAFAVGFLAK
ncbi:hypothetical protein BGZ93_004768 [Podila epicladia]|nr:hypothetical protein BGZ92_009247 [Podila epicladia]KAG0099998.1 hypothetical protein BGZ93_004768 [Podila epicladia]